MLHESNYQVIITHEGILVFLVKFHEREPEKPFLLYDGSNHATFYRRADETVLFDYLNPQIVPILQQASKIVVFELSDETQDIARDYEAAVKHVKKNTFTDGLK